VSILQTDEAEAAVELLAHEREHEASLVVGTRRIPLGAVDASIPEHDRPAAVLTRRDDAFELAVLERVVLGRDGEAALFGVEARALRHRPRLEHAVDLEAQIVVQAPRIVFLDAEHAGFAGAPRRPDLVPRAPAGLGGPVEVALLPVRREGF